MIRASQDHGGPTFSHRALVAFGVAALLAACGAAEPARFAGSTACAECHADEAAAWRGSQHARAIQPAADSTVLAPFLGESEAEGGVAFVFERKDGRFVVRTAGADGAPQEHAVTHAFGLAPLQQYLVELPGGRRQGLTLAWDSRAKAQGGQRWFTLYPGEALRAGDPLHWTGYLNNWNQQCADCHSTDVRKNYDPAERAYRTTASEDGVGCEACHGPGSAHVAWARRPGVLRALWRDDGLAPRLDERRGATWTVGTTGTPPVRSVPRAGDREIETCARCHGRRSQLTDAVSAADPLHDGFRMSLLEPGLYHDDGQQRDEVYTYGSFLQSRMHARGVTCSDCHDPHTQGLRAPGNAACAPCHDAATYDAPAHTYHAPGTPGAACADCHMPATTYMVVDPRHDHSFRVPRPDRTVSLGVPNACDACHADRGAAWAAAEIARRKPAGAKGAQDFAEAFAALARGERDAAGAVLGVAADTARPAIVRASALERLHRAGAPLDGALLVTASRDPSALVRRAVATAAGGSPDPSLRRTILEPLLADPVRSVRVEAASGLLAVPAGERSSEGGQAFERAFGEYVAAQRFTADRPESQVNLGTALGVRGDLAGARAAFREAVALDPRFVPAYVNLADLERAAGNEAEAEVLLRRAVALDTASGTAVHALGLSLVRQGRLADALPALAEAARREPGNARFAYVHGVALHDAGRREEALGVLGAALLRHPGDPALREAVNAFTSELR